MAEEDTLLREVDDMLRHDRMVALWKQYRTPVLASALALIVATAGGTLWSGYQDKRAGQAMQQFAIAQDQFNSEAYAEAADSFATTADVALKPELRDLAHLWQGRALDKAGKADKAVPLFEQVATNPEGSDAIWSDLACLRLVALAPKKNTCLSAGASPLAGERDLVRAATLWQEGKTEEAAKILTALSTDAKQSEAVRTRAQHYLSAVAAPAKNG